jgi:formylglycine-generating enzyme required for sulfatase activity
MTGNVYEWCQDSYNPFWYKKNTVKNPVNLQPSDYRILRGGSTFTWDFEMDNAERHFTPAGGFYYDVGFRIVRTDKLNEFVDLQMPEWKKASLRIESDPEGADIFIDNTKQLKKTPSTVELVEGYYEIKLEKEGYNPHREVLYLKTSASKTIRTSLKKVAENAFHKILLPEEVYVKGGSFVMGDHYGDLWRDAKPPFPVQLTYDYHIGQYEITNEEFLSYLNDKQLENTVTSALLAEISLNFSPFFPEYFLNRDAEGYFYLTQPIEKQPVVMLIKKAVFDYCNWLSDKKGLRRAYDKGGNLIDRNGNLTDNVLDVEGYRLPTEAEWEYAALGGQFSRGYRFAGGNVMTEVGWGWINSGDELLGGPWDKIEIMSNNCRLHDVGLKRPNELGLYDMSGNAWEMCQDGFIQYDKSAKVNPYTVENFTSFARRGGAFCEEISHLKIQHRFCNDFYGRNNDLGFRIARTIGKVPESEQKIERFKNIK